MAETMRTRAARVGRWGTVAGILAFVALVGLPGMLWAPLGGPSAADAKSLSPLAVAWQRVHDADGNARLTVTITARAALAHAEVSLTPGPDTAFSGGAYRWIGALARDQSHAATVTVPVDGGQMVNVVVTGSTASNVQTARSFMVDLATESSSAHAALQKSAPVAEVIPPDLGTPGVRAYRSPASIPPIP